jgi:hypothetical protein
VITAAEITVFHLFDVADAIDLTAVARLVGAAATPARLAPRPTTPAYVQYAQPPVAFDGETLALPPIESFRVRVKLFDYGVISLALSRGFTGTWVELIGAGQLCIESETLAACAEQRCRAIMAAVQPALARPRARLLQEDYAVFAVNELSTPMTAEELLAAHGEEIALLIVGEREPLSAQERDAALRTRISYLIDDLVIPAWSAAFVYDRKANAPATLEILEFANSQLLEFRYYDELLDAELGRIYGELQQPRLFKLGGWRRYTRTATQLHSLFVDVNDLTDRTENALKFVGDVYAARLFALAAARVGLAGWKQSVREKLQTLDDIYRFVVEQTGLVRGQLLELTIVLILVLELVLFFLGIMT